MRKLGLRMLGPDRPTSLSRIPLSQSKNCHSAVALPKFDIMAAREICRLPLRIVIIHASQIEGRPDVPILHQVCTIKQHHGSRTEHALPIAKGQGKFPLSAAIHSWRACAQRQVTLRRFGWSMRRGAAARKNENRVSTRSTLAHSYARVPASKGHSIHIYLTALLWSQRGKGIYSAEIRDHLTGRAIHASHDGRETNKSTPRLEYARG